MGGSEGSLKKGQAGRVLVAEGRNCRSAVRMAIYSLVEETRAETVEGRGAQQDS